jgi:SAM-dependent methyltransferase
MIDPRRSDQRLLLRTFLRMVMPAAGALALSVWTWTPASAAQQGEVHRSDSAARAHGHDSATVRHRFEDAEHWAKVFEDSARDAWQLPDHVLGFLALDSAALVADIGSATGYFDVRFARAVPHGKVYAIDIEPNLVEYLNRRAEREGLGNLVSLLGEPADPKIPEPVDLIFLCDTYHHIDDRVAYFHRLTGQLRPGGRLVVIDFKPGELPVGPGPDHKVERERITAELYAAGFDLKRADTELPYQFILEFGLRPGIHLEAPGPESGRRKP